VFFIFGFGKRTINYLGSAGLHVCPNCHNRAEWSRLRIRTWFTLFFIPVIPYRTRYVTMCPVCKHEVKTDGNPPTVLLGR
jgi:hypothetical protein